jgi:outer membrane protein
MPNKIAHKEASMSAERSSSPSSRRSPPLSRLSRLGLALSLMLGAVGVAQAQSLQELYEAARGYDASYLAARSLAESVQYRVEQSRALLRPSASLSGGVSRINSEGTAPTSNTNGSQIGVTAAYPLFNRANSVTVEQAVKQLDLAKAQLDSAEQDLIVRVAQAYFDVLAAQDALNTTRTSKAAITEQLASAKRNFEVGTATITDTREAQARYDLATAQEIAAENDLRTKRIALDQLVGRTNVNPKPLLVPVTLPPVLPADPEVWVTNADAQHPGILQSRINYEVARLEIDKARAANLPTVGLTGGYTRNHAGSNLATLAGNKNDLSVGVQLGMPLFTGFATQNRIKEVLVLEEKARNDLEAARRQVWQGTRQAYFGVQSGQAQVKALEAAESSTKLALEATQLGYKVGVRVNLDVLNAQTLLFQTQRDLAKARYDVLVGSLKLRQAAGQLNPEDVAALNQVIAK